MTQPQQQQQIHLPIFMLQMELDRLKNYPVGHFHNKEAMAIHQEFMHRAYWALEHAKKAKAEADAKKAAAAKQAPPEAAA